MAVFPGVMGAKSMEDPRAITIAARMFIRVFFMIKHLVSG